jgi:hypothetical protein
MRPRSFATATVVALALVLPAGAGAASAASWQSADCASTSVQEVKVAKAQKAKKVVAKAKKAKKAKKVRTSFNVGGKFCSVDGAMLVLAVHGGQDKGLRGKTLAVTVAADAKVTRDEAPATLADLVAGDHVRVKGTKLKVVLPDGTEATVYNVTRVAASAPEPDEDEEAPAPVV